jgi:transcriptional regulator
MYIPKINQETDLSTQQGFMMAHNFAILVNHHDGQLNATHLPLILDKERGEYGTLIGHMARANKQWKAFGEDEVMVIFNGPHAYISPTWYEEHPSVPTWNYATVHAYGMPRLIEEPQAVDDALHALVKNHEKHRNPEWIMDLPTDYMDMMRKAIVAFEIEITRLEARSKLSQNKSEADKQNIIDELLKSDYVGDVATGELMQLRKDKQYNGH